MFELVIQTLRLGQLGDMFDLVRSCPAILALFWLSNVAILIQKLRVKAIQNFKLPKDCFDEE